MDGVGPGTLLAGRYHVQQRVHQGTWSSIWQAVDETLERPVSLRVVDSGHPRGSDVVDAARRAAGVEDPRLQRILDVGVEDGLTYVVSEWVGADSLTDLIRSGLPPADEVRRLVGEAATALEAARHRGLHHLMLTPDSLLRGHDGPVTVTGLAVDAALAGTDIARRRRGQPARCARPGGPDLRRPDRPLAAGPDARAGAAAAGGFGLRRTLRARLRRPRRPRRPVPARPERHAVRRSGRPRSGGDRARALAGRPGRRAAPDRAGPSPSRSVGDHAPPTAVHPGRQPGRRCSRPVNAPRPAGAARAARPAAEDPRAAPAARARAGRPPSRRRASAGPAPSRPPRPW